MAQTLAPQDLQLKNSTAKFWLTELPLRAIPAEPNLYLDEGAVASPSLQVFQRGVPANGPIAFSLYQTDNHGNPTGSQAATTDAAGVLTIPITAGAGSEFGFVPSFSSADPPSQGIYPPVNTYRMVRVRRADNVIAQMDPTWENLYVNVLANRNAMAPCMDTTGSICPIRNR
jgi:hypothetical protein